MANKGTIQTSLTLPVDLWNKAQHTMKNEGINNFSYFIQKSLRVNIKAIERRNVSEYVDSLDENELELLKKELKKRS